MTLPEAFQVVGVIVGLVTLATVIFNSGRLKAVLDNLVASHGELKSDFRDHERKDDERFADVQDKISELWRGQ
jgi:hypothetical protein